LAFAYDVSVATTDTYESIADDVAPGDNGRAVVAIGDYTPATLMVVVHTAINVSNQGLACSSEGDDVPAELGGDNAAIPVFDVSVTGSGNVDCVVYLYGSMHDDLLNIRTVDADDSTDSPAAGAGDEELIRLPNTGAAINGQPRSGAAGLLIPLALLLLAAGLRGLRTSRA
jgi:hypothetical protein